jgi:stage V sporulation protein B
MRLFLYNGCLLTLTALVMRSISMSYQIYLSRRLGSTGMGLFTLIMSVYGFAVTLASSGNHLATVRMVSAAIAKESDRRLSGALRRCLTYSAAFGGGAAVLLFLLAPTLGAYALCDLRTVRALRVLAVGLPFVSITSCIYGYFHAVRRVTVSSAMQTAEQFAYMLLTAWLLGKLMPQGIEYACLAIVLGSCLSDAIGCVVTIFLLRHDRRKHRLQKGSDAPHQTKELLFIALPVAFSAYARSALVTIEHILIPKGLRKHGAVGDSALASYGVLHGMALPCVLFAQVFLASFASLLIPEFSESYTKGDWNRIRSISYRAFALTLPFSIGVGAFLLCFADELGTFLFSSPDVARYIRYLAPLVPVMYLDTVTDQMLKGINEQFYSMRVNILDAAISVIGVALLLPRFGLVSYFWIVYACELLNALCSVAKLFARTQVRPNLTQWGYLPLLSAVGAIALTHLCQSVLSKTLPAHNALSLFFSVLVFFSCYLFFLFSFRVWKREAPALQRA